MSNLAAFGLKNEAHLQLLLLDSKMPVMAGQGIMVINVLHNNKLREKDHAQKTINTQSNELHE